MSGTTPYRILVVDDEPPIVRFLRASLATQGYIVSAAGDARTALEMIRRGAADLLVLDLGLPDMDGLDVVKQIRGTGTTIPIIILSSRDEESAKVEALDNGADDYVTKPFGISELFGTHPHSTAPFLPAGRPTVFVPSWRTER
jgi:two-component system, OmpR family, KDP operon response regulator KdpE